ncbi:713_t:CDS:2 [Dentiscutata erythropus]|uniref:713_t:CDS:1 n=1 Tax=Dentiscutata erythropus TaxID=1348616 RepID=A0A9N9ELU7_9GLOM|nr:713_t:CDS:2 [Dentiscutata erythropus]
MAITSCVRCLDIDYRWSPWACVPLAILLYAVFQGVCIPTNVQPLRLALDVLETVYRWSPWACVSLAILPYAVFQYTIDFDMHLLLICNWSVVKLLEYVESKSDISDDVFETLKEEIRLILLSYKSSCNTNENAEIKAEEFYQALTSLFPQPT